MLLHLFILVSFFVSFPCHAFTKEEKELLDQLIVEKKLDQPIHGLHWEEIDKKNPKYKEFFALCQTAQAESVQLFKLLKRGVLNFDSFQILHPQCGFGYFDRFLSKKGAFVTCFQDNSLKLRDLRRIVGTTPSWNDGPFLKEVSLRDQLDVLRGLDYFEYDLIILDTLLEELLASKSLSFIQGFLESIMGNTPFLILKIPKNIKKLTSNSEVLEAAKDPKKFFPNLNYLSFDVVRSEDHITYFIHMQGTDVKDKTYKGYLKSYRAKRERVCWIGEDKVIKQYLFTRQQPGDLRLQFDRTLAFYKRAEELGFDFLPKLFTRFHDDKRGVLVIKKEGRNLIKAFLYLSAEQLQEAARQVLDILIKLEKHDFTCGDIRGSNFVINEAGKVFVIDYDLASFGCGPTLRDFVMTCWNMTNGYTKDKNSEMTLEKLTHLPVAKFGPLKFIVKPIFEGKVSTLKELKSKI